MKILFCGDVVGRSGRDAIATHLPALRRRLAPDFVVANGENAAHGFGITARLVEELCACGIDVITSGNHVWDQREIIGDIDQEPRLLRPLNFPAGTPGLGARTLEDARGRRLLVVNVMGRLFMDALDDPFAVTERVLAGYRLGATVDAILIDVHAEATAEKQAFAYAVDGRVSVVVGTHTHVPTADVRILPGGTAFQSDAGMTGDYDSVIGMRAPSPVQRFVRKMPADRLEPADGEGTLCGLFVTLDPASGRAVSAEPVRVGGCLSETLPAPSV